MCGIFGHTIASTLDLDHSRSALHTLTHRGPDQWGDYSDDKVYSGHRRLSIIDLSEAARQPMTNADESVIVSVNGEIYNFQALRKELIEHHEFKSQSDSEVILHGYKQWGITGLLERIDGMFAFSIYDKAQQKLFLVRDRVGIKPLMYAMVEGQLVWASELKAISQFLPADKLAIDNTALYDFLTYLYIPAPKTMYKQVFKLEPAHYLEFDLSGGSVCDGTHKKSSYWQLPTTEQAIESEDAAQRLRELLDESVSEQMVADVPVGYFLSGGLDSSTVLAIASQFKDKLHTYTIGFTDQAHDETAFAKIVADKFETEHRSEILAEQTVQDLFPQLKQWYDEPFADSSAFPTFLISQLSRQTLTVVLTGDGGDEIFGGYKWYAQFDEKYNPYRITWKPLRSIVATIKNSCSKNIIGKIARRVETHFILDELELYTRLMGGMLANEKTAYREKWDIPEDYDDYWAFRKHYHGDLPLMTRLQVLDFHTYLPDDILTKVDRVSMAVALEARVPLLSRKVIEFLFSLPHDIRCTPDNLKGLMKAAYQDHLPASIITRPKKGFSIPTNTWKASVVGSATCFQERVLRELFFETLGDKKEI